MRPPQFEFVRDFLEPQFLFWRGVFANPFRGLAPHIWRAAFRPWRRPLTYLLPISTFALYFWHAHLITAPKPGPGNIDETYQYCIYLIEFYVSFVPFAVANIMLYRIARSRTTLLQQELTSTNSHPVANLGTWLPPAICSSIPVLLPGLFLDLDFRPLGMDLHYTHWPLYFWSYSIATFAATFTIFSTAQILVEKRGWKSRPTIGNQLIAGVILLGLTTWAIPYATLGVAVTLSGSGRQDMLRAFRDLHEMVYLPADFVTMLLGGNEYSFNWGLLVLIVASHAILIHRYHAAVTRQ